MAALSARRSSAVKSQYERNQLMSGCPGQGIKGLRVTWIVSTWNCRSRIRRPVWEAWRSSFSSRSSAFEMLFKIPLLHKKCAVLSHQESRDGNIFFTHGKTVQRICRLSKKQKFDYIREIKLDVTVTLNIFERWD